MEKVVIAWVRNDCEEWDFLRYETERKYKFSFIISLPPQRLNILQLVQLYSPYRNIQKTHKNTFSCCVEQSKLGFGRPPKLCSN